MPVKEAAVLATRALTAKACFIQFIQFKHILPLGLLVQVEYMKSLGFFDKKHNRRRDEFVNYVEAHAKMSALTHKGPGH